MKKCIVLQRNSIDSEGVEETEKKRETHFSLLHFCGWN